MTKNLLSITLLSPLFFVGCAARADNITFEAETNPTSGDIKILDLPGASGGKAVSIARDRQPLFKSAVPAGNAFNIWARYQGGAILAKKTPGGNQADLKWVYAKPTELTWTNLGRYSREELGDNFLIVRGGGGGQGPVVDCVTFAGDKSFNPTKNVDTTGTAVTNIAPLPANQANTSNGAASTANIDEGAALALGMINVPKGILVEAETNKPGGTNQIVEIEGASGGKAVTTSSDYQNIFQAPLPGGEAWRIFVRHKGGPFSLKVQAAGKSQDRWFYRQPSEWAWTETDVFSREDLGGKELRIGRGTSGNVFIDAVVLAPETKRILPADKPDANAPAQKIAASINWEKSAGTLPAMAWGINEHEILNPRAANEPEFQKLLGALNPSLIRVHHAGFMDSWTDEKTRDWNVEKIKAGFAASTGYGNAPLMLNLTWAPKWMGGKKVLTVAEEDELAALWGRLVAIMRDEVKRPVAYWEITNELEGTYEKAGQLPALWRLYNKAAAAMRRQDPKAKLGGMGFTYAKPAWVEGFLQNCDDVQFLSWHNYGTGDLYHPNDKIFAAVDSNVSALAKGALEAVQRYGRGRQLETFLTETNVKYTWDPYERRHQNAVGSLFHASVVHKVSRLGVSGINLWQQRGNAYGSLITGKGETFPSYTLYGWGPKYLTGKLAAATSGDDKLLEIIPVEGERGQKAVLLLNKAPHTLILPPAKTLLPAFKTAQQISSEGIKNSLSVAVGDFPLPGYSMTLIASN